MRMALSMLALVFCCFGCTYIRYHEPSTKAAGTTSSPSPTQSITADRVDFNRQIRPILEARCKPCHFAGGKIYGRLPSDRPETISTLGAKLFTRIKDDREQRLIREFRPSRANR